MPSGALPSNAGDRYHFVYVARRLIDMLRPGTPLRLVELEGITLGDALVVDDVDSFLAVDHCEYYGGENAVSAKQVHIVQVKYSPLHPGTTWTASRLLREPRGPGSSVLRKLARAFEKPYVARADGRGIQLKLVTNQPIHATLRATLVAAKGQVCNRADLEAGRALREVGNASINELRKGTRLSWKCFAALIRSWDLTTFAEELLSKAEGDLFLSLDRYTSQAGMQVGRLISFVQESATSHRPQEIRPRTVRGIVGIRRRHFWPAPSMLSLPDDYLTTSSSRAAAAVVKQQRQQLMLLHGAAGVGKTACAQLLTRDYDQDLDVVIYDCFGAGTGMQAGVERFPRSKCFTQIINELDAKLGTSVLATTRLDYEDLMIRFVDAIKRAATRAAGKGRRLIVAIDAVDNAVDVAGRHPLHGEQLFLSTLLRIELPSNCTILMTTRTENIPKLSLPAEIIRHEMAGFTEDESIKYVAGLVSDATPELLKEIHKRTRGNPRAMKEIARQLLDKKPADPMTFVVEYARDSTVAFYEAECAERLVQNSHVRLLAVLREAIPPVAVETLGNVTGRSTPDVKRILEQLSFGVRINDDERVEWIDQDFWDVAHSFTKDHTTWARGVLSDFCKEHFRVSRYATRNYSKHALLAKRPEELLTWWLNDGRLAERIAAKPRQEEAILEDIGHCLHAAVETGSYVAVMQLLALGGDAVQGRDLFLEALADHPRVAVERSFVA